MAKRLMIGMSLVISSALLAWLVSLLVPSAPSQTNQLSPRAVARYPDTGLPSIVPSLDSSARRAKRISTDGTAGRVIHSSGTSTYQNTISPDEDLLWGIEAPAAGPATDAPSYPSTTAPTLPTIRPLPQVPKSVTDSDQTPPTAEPTAAPAARHPMANLHSAAQQPQAKQHSPEPTPPPPESTPPPPEVQPLASAPPSVGYDPQAPPAPDEDLLQAAPESPDVSSAVDQPARPIEAIPNRPVPDAELPQPPTESITRPDRAPSAFEAPPQPPRQLPPYAAPAAPLVPPQDAAPLMPHGAGQAAPSAGVDPHAAVFADTLYPSAKNCRTCHKQIYDEWAMSSHAYAAISPMFQCFEQTITSLTRGTIGYFCMRCHAPVATAMFYPREGNILETPGSFHEGVTCVACHRVREQYGKANGERRIEPGDVYEPVYGSGYGEGLAEVLKNKSHYKVKPYPKKGPGQDIHREVIHFEQISDSSFCVSCHQVFVAPGIELEVVWEQYRALPACKLGITCQDCHMGIEPGVAEGYPAAPVAVVNDKPISPHRKHSNHVFYGPGYSIAHPGIFPFNPDAEDWTHEEWLSFDYRAGWGTDPFEDAVKDGRLQVRFPKCWENSDDRYDAREIVDANLAKLRAKLDSRRRLMENSSEVEGPIFDSAARVGKPLKFHYVVTNTNSGHNMPSGSLGAQPQLWVNVALTGPGGEHLWESGYVDANGDIADAHSLEVAAHRIPRDQQLVNYQTKFLITGVKGTDREMYLPINVDFDPLPFIRPSAFPVTTMNHPPFIRMEAHSIPAWGSRAARYKVPARFMQQPGKYRLSIRMRSRAEPIYFMRFCGATPEMERNMNEWMLDYHEQATEFWVR